MATPATLQYIGDAHFQAGALAAGYTAGGLSLSLVAGQGTRFPSTGVFYVRVDDEVFLVTANAADVLTVTGAQDGTVASNHNSGTAVIYVIGAAAIDQWRKDVIRIGTVADLPAAGKRKQGDLYYPSDGIYDHYLFDGSIWQPFKAHFPCTEPVNGDFAWVNQVTATVSTAFGGVYLESPTAGTDEWNLRTKAAPAPPYTLTVAFIPETQPVTNFSTVGIGFRDSASGKINMLNLLDPNNTGGPQIFCDNWTNPTTFSATAFSLSAVHNISFQPLFFRIEDDNTNRNYYVSNSGRKFRQIGSIPRTTFLTADHIVFGVKRPNSGTGRTGMFLLHWLTA